MNKTNLLFGFLVLVFSTIEVMAQTEEIWEGTEGESARTTININSSAGVTMQTNKKGAFFLNLFDRVSGFIGGASGTLINTVNQNGKLYIVSAAHTIVDTNQFNNAHYIGKKYGCTLSNIYEITTPSLRKYSSRRSDFPDDRRVFRTNLTVVAIDQKADTVLFEIDQLSSSLLINNLYFAGWSLRAGDSNTGLTIMSHPSSDYKKNAIIPDNTLDIRFLEFNPPGGGLNTLYDGVVFRSEQLHEGSSGAGVLDDDASLIGIFSRPLDRNSSSRLVVASLLKNSWYNTNNGTQSMIRDFVDPIYTYASKIPGGRGLYGGDHLINPNHFDLQIPGSSSMQTTELIRLYDLDVLAKKANKLGQGGIFLKNGNVKLKVSTVFRNNTITLYESKADGSGIKSNDFEETIITSPSNSNINTVLRGLGLNSADLQNKKYEHNLPVTIELVNLGSTPAKVRALKIPGLGYRNTVELFKPNDFAALYTNKNYPKNRASNSTNTYLHALKVKVTDPESGTAVSKTYTTENNGGYVDLIQHTFPIMKSGASVELSFTPRTTGGTMHYSAWIDYNSNQRFDVNEQVGTATSSTNTITFTVPDKPNKGTRIRIAMRKNSAPPANGSRSYDIGEVEDYTVKIVPSNRNSEVLASSVSQLSIGTGNYIAKPEGDKALSTGRKTNSNGGTTTVVTQVPVTDSSGNTSYATASVIDIQPTSDPNDGDLYTFKVKEGYLAVDTSSKLTSSTFNGKTILIRKLKVVNTATPVKVYGFNLTQGGSNKTYYSLQASDGDPYAITSPMELIPVSSISDGTSPTAPTPLSSSVNHADVAKHLTTGDKSGIAIGSATVIGIGVGIIFKFRRTLSRVPGQAMRMVKSCDSKSGGEGVSLLENTEL
ncbi:GEVED domain-containing protein [Aquimarina sp. 2201CG1-2-11]|uniref:GEVED domain-containing protein n=1 Tax=Aquimarina discodermiae TaxID=3231043 RepID=UPI003462F836